jgi:hypothetical protein
MKRLINGKVADDVRLVLSKSRLQDLSFRKASKE